MAHRACDSSQGGRHSCPANNAHGYVSFVFLVGVFDIFIIILNLFSRVMLCAHKQDGVPGRVGVHGGAVMVTVCGGVSNQLCLLPAHLYVAVF